MIALRGEEAGGQTVAEVVGLDQTHFLYSLGHFWGSYSFWKTVAF